MLRVALREVHPGASKFPNMSGNLPALAGMSVSTTEAIISKLVDVGLLGATKEPFSKLSERERVRVLALVHS